MAKTHHTAIDARGRTWERTSTSKVYTHAVITCVPERIGNDRIYPAKIEANFCGSLALAEKQAATNRKGYAHVQYSGPIVTEICTVTRTTDASRLRAQRAQAADRKRAEG